MVCCSLDSENPVKSCKREVQIFRATLRTHIKLPRPSRVCISEKPPSIWRMSLSRNNACHAIAVVVELTGAPRPNRGAGHRQGQGPHKRAELLLHRLKNAESNAALLLKGLDEDSLVIEHIQVNKAPRVWCWTYRACGRMNPHTWALPATLSCSFLKRADSS